MNAHVTTFFSAKGGSGQSLVSTNYALLLSQKSKTLFIQLADYADAHTFFGIAPRTHLLHMIEFLDEEEAVENALSELAYKVENLSILLSPQKAGLYNKITAEQLAGLLEILVTQYNDIVIDLGVDFPFKKAVLATSNQVLVVSNIDPQSVRKTNALVERLEREAPETRVSLVLNQVPPTMGQKKLKEYFPGNIICTLPYDSGSAWDNIALGVPYTKTKSSLSKKTNELLKNSQ